MGVTITTRVMQIGNDKGFELIKRRLNVELYIRLMQTGRGKGKEKREVPERRNKTYLAASALPTSIFNIFNSLIALTSLRKDLLKQNGGRDGTCFIRTNSEIITHAVIAVQNCYTELTATRALGKSIS